MGEERGGAGEGVAVWIERSGGELTWHCHNLPQLLLQAHDVFAQLNVIHPATTADNTTTEKSSGSSKCRLPACLVSFACLVSAVVMTTDISIFLGARFCFLL